MRVFVQFSETYLEWISKVCFALKQHAAPDPLHFCGLALRRKTVCPKLDSMSEPMGLGRYDWLNDVEKRILASDIDVPARIEHYRRQLGDRKLRLVLNCDRDLCGELPGGLYPRTRLRSMVEREPALRWKYAVGMLDYYLDRFAEEKPDLVFFNEVSFAWEMSAYLAAEHLGIPFAALCYVRSGMGYAVIGNAFDRCETVDRLFERSASNPSLIADHREEAEAMLSAFREQPTSPEYKTAHETKMRRAMSTFGIARKLGENLLKCVAVQAGLFGIRGILRFENWMDVTRADFRAAMQYRRCRRSPSVFERAGDHVKGRYLYYPLHVEPESSTMVFSSDMTNQLFFIEQLSRHMPAGYKLLVKEHLTMLGRRPRGFYRRIRSLPDTVLLSPMEDNFELIKRAEAVCVLTGTSGWEAIMLGVPVLVVGQAQYMGIGAGYVRCEDLLRLDRDIRRVLDLEPVPDDVLVRYIAASRGCLSGMDTHSIAYWHYGLSPEDTIKEEGIEGVARQLLDFHREAAQGGAGRG